MELFAEHGYREIGIDDIVARCGVSRATFYGYFRNKRDLLDVILRTTEGNLVSAVAGDEDWSALADREAYVVGFHAMVRRVTQYFADNARLLSFVILTAPGVDAEAFDALWAAYRRLGAQAEAILAVATSRGWAKIGDGVHPEWAGLMVVSCIAASVLPLLLNSGEQVDVAAASRFCGDYLLGGIPAVSSH